MTSRVDSPRTPYYYGLGVPGCNPPLHPDHRGAPRRKGIIVRIRHTRNIVASVLLGVTALAFVSCHGTAPIVSSDISDAADGFQKFDTPPVLTYYEAPRYPEAARRDGVEGSVVIRVDVGTDGSVVDATIVESSNPVFNDAALSAANAFRFTPGSLEGRPVRCRVIVPVAFAL